jgi:predicted metal-dependent hydrolase
MTRPQFDLFDTHMADAAAPAGGDAGEAGAMSGPRIRVSKRARRLSVRVYPDARVEVVVPPRTRPHEVERFVVAHREWIVEKRAIALRTRPAPAPFPPPAVELAATGERLRLHFGGGARLRITELGEPAQPDRVLSIAGTAEGAALRRALRAWLKRAARERLEPRLQALARATGMRHRQVSIRLQRSRWGSCSARGTISLNACLLFQRPEVVDYLIVHELMHLKHMNHSARFWRAVEQHCPQWRALDRELLAGWRNVPRWVFLDESQAR